MYVQFNALINVSVQDSAESNLALYGIVLSEAKRCPER